MVLYTSLVQWLTKGNDEPLFLAKAKGGLKIAKLPMNKYLM
jgi:hypothetical protein